MNRIVIGNIVSLIASVMMVLIGFIKDKKITLLYQTVDFGFMSLANIILGGISGFITNLISIVRNIVCLKYKFTFPFKVFFIVLQVVLIFIFSNEGLRAIFPILAVLIYTFVLDTKDIKLFKKIVIVCQLFWVAYDLSTLNISSFVFDVLTIGSNAVSLYRIYNDEKILKWYITIDISFF